jgi:hypothetical protein
MTSCLADAVMNAVPPPPMTDRFTQLAARPRPRPTSKTWTLFWVDGGFAIRTYPLHALVVHKPVCFIDDLLLDEFLNHILQSSKCAVLSLPSRPSRLSKISIQARHESGGAQALAEPTSAGERPTHLDGDDANHGPALIRS